VVLIGSVRTNVILPLAGNLTALGPVDKFLVQDIIWNPSEYKPISVSLKLDVLKSDYSVAASTDISDESSYNRISKPKKIQTENVNWDRYYKLIERDRNGDIVHQEIILSSND
jgi:hypothetical protein